MTENSEYKDMFIEESREHLNTISQALLDFEKDPKDKDAMNKIFRAAHTIKGMSATMNYDTIQKLSHKTEDTLDLIRDNKIEVDTEIIDLIFKCFDGIEEMVEDIASSDMTEFDIEGLIGDLEKHLDGPETGKKTKKSDAKKGKTNNLAEITLDKKTEKKIIKEIEGGKYAYKLYITLEEACMMKSIRSFLLLKKLSDDGTILYSTPDRKSIEDGKFDEGFEIYYASNEENEAIVQLIGSVAEIDTKIVSNIEYEDNKLNIKPSAAEEKPEVKKEEQAPTADETDTKTPEKTTEKKEEKKPKTAKASTQSIRIGMDQLDIFMNLIGELVISKGRLAQIATDHNLSDLSETVGTFDRLTTELQDKITTIRMIPMKHVFDRFPRMVRDLAKSNGKNINLVIEGGDIELDRTILDEIGDPIVHLLRNSIDHGVEPPEIRIEKGKPEQGKVELIAERMRDHVLITVKDDGKGIDPEVMKKAAVRKNLKTQEEVDKLDEKEALALLWLPGLSSAEKITNVSGRGVGMDVVKSTIEKLNGAVELSSEIGVGSTFSLRLPLTMAIFKSLFVGIGKETYAIPISNVSEIISLKKEDITTVNRQATIVLRENVLPLVKLGDIFDLKQNNEEIKTTLNVVIVQKENRQIGLLVDQLIGEQEITIKNIGSAMEKTKGIAGVTIMGDGHVVFVVDINTLIN